MVPSSSAVVGTPRWWMEPRYEPLLRDREGLAWELNGASVRTLTEDSFYNSSGQRRSTNKPNPVAEKWAENMTDQFAALALAEPVFGELRNCMELAIVGALIVKERLPEKAGYSLPVLMTSTDLQPAEYNAPKQVPSYTSVLPKGQRYIVTVSGGVAINSWIIADNTKESDSAAPFGPRLRLRTIRNGGGTEGNSSAIYIPLWAAVDELPPKVFLWALTIRTAYLKSPHPRPLSQRERGLFIGMLPKGEGTFYRNAPKGRGEMALGRRGFSKGDIPRSAIDASWADLPRGTANSRIVRPGA